MPGKIIRTPARTPQPTSPHRTHYEEYEVHEVCPRSGEVGLAVRQYVTKHDASTYAETELALSPEQADALGRLLSAAGSGARD